LVDPVRDRDLALDPVLVAAPLAVAPAAVVRVPLQAAARLAVAPAAIHLLMETVVVRLQADPVADLLAGHPGARVEMTVV
jgi:hypothetical protein